MQVPNIFSAKLASTCLLNVTQEPNDSSETFNPDLPKFLYFILLLISFDPCQFDIAQTKQEYGQLLILVAMAFQQSHEKYPEDEP